MTRYSAAALVAGAMLSAFVSVPAMATASVPDSLAGLQAMRELNLIVFGNTHFSGQEVEGKTFIGGDLTGNGTNWGIGNSTQGAAVSGWKTLTVNGNSSNAGQINNGSNGGVGLVATSPGALIGGNSVNFQFNAAGSSFDVGGALTGNTNLSSGQLINIGGSASGVNGTGGAVVNAGGAISGNQNGATFNQNLGAGWNAATTSVVTAGQKADLQADLTKLSGDLKNLAIISNPSTITAGGQGPIFNVVPNANGFALFDFSSAQFGNEINFLGAGSANAIVVNVSGTNINWNMNPVGGYNGSLNQSIIWNFYEATNVNINKFFHGSILAPLANVINSGPIEGSVVALEFTSNNEVHLGTYSGSSAYLTSEPLPEPATWAMLLMGFGMVGVTVRRRRNSGIPVATA